MMLQKNIPIEKARNIGATIAKRLKATGIHSLADLAEVKPVNAYRQLAAKYPDKHLPVCYYLYSLEGALLDVHWDDIPNKDELRKATEV